MYSKGLRSQTKDGMREKENSLVQKLRSLPESRRMLAYLLMALLAGLFISGALALLPERPWVMSAVKLLIAFGALALAGGAARIPLRRKKSLPWIVLLGMVPALLMTAFYIGPVSRTPQAGAVALVIISMFATALWEEAVFRLWGRLLFEEEGSYKAWIFLAMALIFGGLHLLNCTESGSGVFQAVFAALAGLFLHTFYTWSGSFSLAVLIHWLIDLGGSLAVQWMDPSDAYLSGKMGLGLILVSLYMALSAAILARKGEIIRRGMPFLKLGRKDKML